MGRPKRGSKSHHFHESGGKCQFDPEMVRGGEAISAMKWHFLAISAFNWQCGAPFRGRSGIRLMIYESI